MHDIPLYDSKGEYIEGERNLFTTDYPEESYCFIGKTGPLKSGIYDIEVEYSTHQDDYWISCEYNGDGKHYPAVYEESHMLNSLSNKLIYRIWVNGNLDNVNVKISCGAKDIFEHDSILYIEHIKIARQYRVSVFYKTLKLIMMLLLLDGILFVIYNRRMLAVKIQENFYFILGLTCIFLVSSISIMGNFSVGKHDIPFHYSRIIGLAEGMMNGDFPVKIQPGWLWGYGYAASVCYGDALLYFPAILYMLGVPIVYAYKIYIFVIDAGTLFTSYYSYKKISGDKYIGVTCTALYCLSITRILYIYLHTAVGAYSAFMFLPLVLLGLWQIYTKESKSFKDGALLLCLGITGVIQTHVISAEMTCIFIALAVLLMIRKMSKRIFMALVKSVLSALCLNLGFILPLLDYSTDTLKVFAKKDAYGIQGAGLSVYELFSFITKGVGRNKDSLGGLEGRTPESLGLSMIIVLLLTVVIAVRCREWEQSEKKEFFFSVALTGIALWMTTYYFPYNRLAALPGVKNVLRSFQYPWRFLSIAVPLLTYVACHVFVKIGKMLGKQKLYVIMIGICIITAVQALYCVDMIIRSGDLEEVYYDFRARRNYSWIASGGEYLLTGTDTYQTGVEQDIMGENVQLELLERKGIQMEVFCRAEENAQVVFPLFAYKYYQCMDVETKECFPIMRGENGKIVVELPDYYKGTLKVHFVQPWYWRASEIVSLLTLVWLAIYLWRGRRRSAYRFQSCIQSCSGKK